jgi:hypothetical protein
MSATTVEQSKRLIELGLNPETADMIHPCLIARGEEVMYDDPVPKNSVLYAMHTSLEEKEKSVPAWSSDRLLELMPAYCGIDKEKTEYVASYVCSHEVLKWSTSNPLEAIYNMTVWLLEHNYIKK